MELSVKFASQICHENINKPLDGTYLADFGIDIRIYLTLLYLSENSEREIEKVVFYVETNAIIDSPCRT